MIKKYFVLDETPCHPGKYMIRLNYSAFPNNINTSGSFNILPARLLRLHYAEYLRYCRDVCDAEIIGKNCYYPIPFFKNNQSAKELVALLNARMALVATHWRKE